IFEIPAAPKGQPVSWKGHYYGRDGESLGALSDFDRDRIKAQIIQKDWSAEIIDDASIEDLSKEAIDFARIQYKEKNGKLKEEIDSWSNELFLHLAFVDIPIIIQNIIYFLFGIVGAYFVFNHYFLRMSDEEKKNWNINIDIFKKKKSKNS